MTTPTPEPRRRPDDDDPTELFDVFVERIDAVDKPATGRKFLVIKNADGRLVPDPTDPAMAEAATALADAAYLALGILAGEKELRLSQAALDALNALGALVEWPGKFGVESGETERQKARVAKALVGRLAAMPAAERAAIIESIAEAERQHGPAAYTALAKAVEAAGAAH